MFDTSFIGPGLPFEQALTMGVRPGWIAQELVAGKQALLMEGQFYVSGELLRTGLNVPSSLAQHTFDGVLTEDTFHIYDLLMFHRHDVRRWPLAGRLRAMTLLDLPTGYRRSAAGSNVGEFLEAVVADGGDGIMLRQLGASYDHGRTLKVVWPREQEVVITTLHQQALAATVAQFAGAHLVERGKVYLGEEFHRARLAQVIRVKVQSMSPLGLFQGMKFESFLHAVRPAECRVS
jgi:hypothetical protein